MFQDNHGVNALGHFTVAGVDTVALAQKYGTPLYIMDEELMRQNCRRYVRAMKECFGGASKPLFAGKALDCKAAFRIAFEEGMGADVVSAGELYTALAAGLPAEALFFHGSAKTSEEIRYGIDAGVGFFVVDNAEELRRISACAAETGRRQKLLLRVTPGIDPHTFEAVNTGRVDSKFGAAVETGQAFALAELALALPAVELQGFHCHIGSQIFEAAPFLDAAEIMLSFMDEVRARLGFTATVLDLGGGMAVRYAESDPSVDYEAVLAAVAAKLRDGCAARSYPLPTVYTEPGRSIVGAAGVTLYTVQSIKHIEGYKSYLAVDGGMTDNPRYALYGARHPALVANRAVAPTEARYTLAGRACESGDLLGEDVAMQRAKVGDTVAVLVTGAYNHSMASNYNRVPRPPLVLLRGGEERLAVRRESWEELCERDI